MSELRARVPESTVKALARRTTRLCELVDRATSVSPHKQIRDGGAQLIDLLNERMEEIVELQAMEDEDLPERLRAFTMRIELAELKVMTWPQAKVTRRGKNAESNGRRSPRRTHRKAA